jgi:ribonuclease HII
MTVNEIRQYLQQESSLSEGMLEALERDPRRTVARMVAQYRRRCRQMEEQREHVVHLLAQENALRQAGYSFVAGVDEAGRGALAGPVVAAAVLFPPGVFIPQVDDSKKLTAKQRQQLFHKIKRTALGVATVAIDAQTIDELNILQATYLAMGQALGKLVPQPDHCLVDGYPVPTIAMEQTAVVGGDRTCFSIAAASIVAKVVRDEIMLQLARAYPQYGFARNKGYCTREHRQALKTYGPSPEHRRCFRPVAEAGQLSIPWKE